MFLCMWCSDYRRIVQIQNSMVNKLMLQHRHRYRPKGVFGKGVGNSQNASEMRQNGSCFIGKRGTSKMRQKSVKIASKMRQKCAEHLWGRTPFGRYRRHRYRFLTQWEVVLFLFLTQRQARPYSQAIAPNSEALEWASDVLRGDHEIVLAAVSQTGRALQFASSELRGFRDIVLSAVLSAPKSQRFLCDLRFDAHRGPQKSQRSPKQEKAMLHCDLRVRWKVASDLRFRSAISEPKTPSFCGISGDLAPSTRKSLAIAIVRFWSAKVRFHRAGKPCSGHRLTCEVTGCREASCRGHNGEVFFFLTALV